MNPTTLPFPDRESLAGTISGLTDHDMAVDFEQACFQRGVLTLTCGQRGVRLAPPLVVTEEQCDTALGIMAEACEAVTR